MAFDAGQTVDALYLDLSKAFDKVSIAVRLLDKLKSVDSTLGDLRPGSTTTYQVSHRLLLKKLESIDLTPGTTSWLHNYLSDRYFCVRVGSSVSAPQSSLSGVPQGSILGPLLFLLFVNDLPTVVSSPCLMYAADIKLWCTVDTIANYTTLQQDLSNMTEWLDKHMLPVNVDKCVCLHPSRSRRGHSYHLGSLELRASICERDL